MCHFVKHFELHVLYEKCYIKKLYYECRLCETQIAVVYYRIELMQHLTVWTRFYPKDEVEDVIWITTGGAVGRGPCTEGQILLKAGEFTPVLFSLQDNKEKLIHFRVYFHVFSHEHNFIMGAASCKMSISFFSISSYFSLFTHLNFLLKRVIACGFRNNSTLHWFLFLKKATGYTEKQTLMISFDFNGAKPAS